ncbi:MAG: hypothetical protein M9887_04400 [Chitinophagales bacterium]|nr:hypothetical protein [Chitinophagales bacterium]
MNICQSASYTLPNGQSVSESGTYPVTLLQSTAGCDSTIITYLTVSEVVNNEVHAASVKSASYELPDGTTVSEAGTYPYTYTDNNGCTNILVTVLTVNPTYEQANQVNICQGASYTLPNGQSVSESGTYPVTLQSTAGCDSTIILFNCK